MEKGKSSESVITDLDFMFAEIGGSWEGLEYSYKPVFWHRSIADIEEILENEFSDEEPVPMATFKQGFSAEKWKKAADFGEITNYVSDWANIYRTLMKEII